MTIRSAPPSTATHHMAAARRSALAGALFAMQWFGSVQAATATAPAAAAPPQAARSAVLSDKTLATAISRTHILVVGGTGRNGGAIVRALEAAGESPRVMARDVAKAREQYTGLREWVQADLTRPETLSEALRGIDVVINAAATRDIEGPNGVEAVDLGGMQNLIVAAKAAGTRRIVFITGMLVGAPPPNLPPPMAKGFGAKRAAEKALTASGLEYVILRPTGIQQRAGGIWAIRIAATDGYKSSPEEQQMRPGPLSSGPGSDAPPPEGTISRDDLAEVSLVSAVDPQARNRVFVVTQGVGRATPDWRKAFGSMPSE